MEEKRLEYKVMMKCGHSANSMGSKAGSTKRVPACVICSCFEVAETPNLEGRTARCTYFGTVKPRRRYANDECNYGCRGDSVCRCGDIPSKIGLAFFQSHPDKDHDEFYCGCAGWD